MQVLVKDVSREVTESVEAREARAKAAMMVYVKVCRQQNLDAIEEEIERRERKRLKKEGSL